MVGGWYILQSLPDQQTAFKNIYYVTRRSPVTFWDVPQRTHVLIRRLLQDVWGRNLCLCIYINNFQVINYINEAFHKFSQIQSHSKLWSCTFCYCFSYHYVGQAAWNFWKMDPLGFDPGRKTRPTPHDRRVWPKCSELVFAALWPNPTVVGSWSRLVFAALWPNPTVVGSWSRLASWAESQGIHVVV